MSPDHLPKRKVALAVMAHPDDAEMLCAGTLVRLAVAGWQIHIATTCAGDCGTATLSATEITAIRAREAQASAAVIGAAYHWTGSYDGKVCYDPPTLDRVYALFRQVCPTLVITHPQRDYMLDHEQTHQLARAASFAFSARNISTVPMAEADVSVPWLYYTDPIQGVDEADAPVTPTTIIEITQQQETKLQMLACHASQREWLRVHHGVDDYLDAARRHDAWRGSAINVPAAEAFVQHRGHAYPRNDLLDQLFGRS